LIYSDRRKNCVFLYDQERGALIVNFNGKPFTRSLGLGNDPYVLPGVDKTVYITDTPLEALNLKAMHPDSTILATGGITPTGGFMTKERLKPYLEGREKIFSAHGRNHMGEEYARYLARDFPQTQCLMPERGQNWSEERRLQTEKLEREKAEQPEQQTRAQTQQPPTTLRPAITTGWAR
jgi:hypothetical protein